MNSVSLQPLFIKTSNALSKAQLPGKHCPLAGKVAALSKKFEYVSQAIKSSLHHKVYAKITLKNVGKVLGLSLLVLDLSRGFRDGSEKPIEKDFNPIDIKKLALFHMQRLPPLCNPNYIDLNSCQTNLLQNRFTAVCHDPKDSLEFRARIDFDKIDSYIPGQLNCPNGFSYDGNFHIDRLSLSYKLNDQVKVTEPGGNLYSGLLKAGMYEDQAGLVICPNGDKYNGKFKAGKLIKGTKHFPNGDKYEGKFDNYLFEGEGKLTFKSSESVYVGTFNEGKYSDGKFDGFGILKRANGDVYAGNFKEGMYDGRGMLIYVNGESYSGEFKEGKKHGLGIMTWPEGVSRKAKWEGEWKYDVMNGEGVLTYPDGKKYKGEWQDGLLSVKLSNGIKYECEFWQDGYEAYGIYKSLAGEEYKGNFEKGYMQGFGTMIWPDGSKYEGHWKRDFIDGRGIRTYPDGTKYEGEWQEDLMHGLMKITRCDGSIKTINYVEGLSGKL